MTRKIRGDKKNTRFIILGVLIILFFLFLLSSLLGISKKTERLKEETVAVKKIENTFFSSEGGTRISMLLPAVNTEGKGVNTVLKVEATQGTGRTLTDIDNLLFWADTQHSIRRARRVAENITGKKMEDYDIIYAIEANATLIGGPSAGAALTLATISALESRKLKDNVMITGSINHDGSIGPVSGILEKAKAAKEAGGSIFLVPLLQSRDVIYEETENCETFGATEICTTETRPRKIEVENEVGIDIIEVENVKDAMIYFFE